MPATRIAACTVLALRIAYGAALIAAPGRVTRRWLGPAGAQPPSVVGLRALGAREIAVHGAGLLAAARGEPLRPWLAVSVAGDLADIAATAAARDGLPKGSPTATLAVAGGSAAISAALAVSADRDS